MVCFSVSDIKIITAKHVLGEAGIKAFSINKKDSAHAGIFGTIELYVDKEDEEKARKILVNEEIIS